MTSLLTAMTIFAALPLAAETWNNVPMVDINCSNCSAKVKSAPGNAKVLDALRSTKKSDHLSATVTSKRGGDSIHVESIALD